MPYTFKQIAGMSVDQISDLASRGDTYRDFCAAVKKAAKAAAASDAPAPEQTEISVKPMTLTPDAEGTHRTDFFVSIRVGGREVTPHMFRERFKAEYHVALYDWLLNGGVEPDVMEFDENDWPARALPPSTQHVEADGAIPSPELVAWQWSYLGDWFTMPMNKVEDAERYARSMAKSTGGVARAIYAAPPSERKVIEALKGLLVYTFEDDPGTLILSYDGTALARIDLDTEPGSALLKLEQELAALRASGGTP